MRKILFFNFIYKEGHKKLDEKFLCHMQKMAKIDVIEPEEWYQKQPNISLHNVAGMNDKNLKGYRGVFSSCWRYISVAATFVKKNDYEFIVCGENEVIFLPLYKFLIGKKFFKKTVFIHHQDLDYILGNRLLNRFRLKIFNRYKNKSLHWVMEPFIEYSLIREFDVKPDNIICLRHPPCNKYVSDEKEFDCIGLSHSNDDLLIEDLVRKEEQNHLLKKKGLKVVLRSSNINYDDGYLKVISHWLSNDEYEMYMRKARSSFVPLPESFYNRVSGSIIDAFANNMPVITTKTPLTDYYSKEYPNICCIFSSNTFSDDIERMVRSNRHEEDFKKFEKDHDENRLDNCVEMINEKLSVSCVNLK